ncbi:MAG: DNA polymerase III subunit chi [Alphaproteobacteria bacterium]|nr:DNA polymerase III subunit chi [Alphaproteobacteria bacterium]
MTDIAFYHLQRQRLEEALPLLLEKAYEAGLRVVVLAGSPERVEALDQHLWTYRRESFLPHGTKRTGNAAEQPIFLTPEEANPNGASLLCLVDGEASPDFIAGFTRCLDLFDGNDEAALVAARARWSAAKAAGHRLTYWQQGEQGGWQKKAEA